MRGTGSRHGLGVIGLLALILPLLAGCGSSTSDSPAAQDQSAPAATTATIPESIPVSNPSTPAIPRAPLSPAPGGVRSIPVTSPATPPLAVGGSNAPAPDGSGRLTAEEIQIYQPNELGVIPVLQYHVFVTDETKMDAFTTTIDRFTAQLQWLYDHNFFLISMESFIANEIAAPPGKHPIVFTFDDSSPGQFRFIEGEGGALVPDPLSAIGALEDFIALHPDFGRGGFFAVLPSNCFAMPAEPDQMPYCDQKLAWLAERGYEVGNHTVGHQDLRDVTDDVFAREVGDAAFWVRDHVPAPGSLSDVMVMPYGNYPDKETHQEQRRMMRDGFQYEGQRIRIRAAFMVGAEPSIAPSSTLWDPLFISRIQTSDEVLDHWFEAFTDGSVILYVSDGHPGTIVLPTPLPSELEAELDPDLIAGQGKKLVHYHPGDQP
ncbi:MAG: polysaccharide deacetylase family protein [Chloroflexia bacterium]|nr:polysaccharide deacetylase family protein [Chloroflexia bacterium]